MRDVSIVGIGQVPVGEHWAKSLRDIGAEAVRSALGDAGVDRVDGLYVANMLAGELSGQQQVGVLIAEHSGLRGVEAYRIEAACGSGGVAMRAGHLAVASGAMDVVVVAGAEKMTDRPADEVTAGLASAADADFEASMGLSFVAINALMMRRYMHEYRVGHEAFAPFVVNAHGNAVGNPNAMFRFPISEQEFLAAKMIADPVNLLDSSPVCDGAAAVVLCPSTMARQLCDRPVRVLATAVATDSVALHDRREPLAFQAATDSARRVYEAARVGPKDIDLFEVHDAFSITAVLSLEACGFADRGQGFRLGLDGEIGLEGRLPISTFGGLKARGHPVGATGIYQIAEVAHQLRGTAGKNQVSNPRFGMAQNLGGSAATVATTLLGAPE
jgi:acetyl-CoA C-acetyltransferase